MPSGSMVESSVASSAGFHVAFSKKIITSVELTGIKIHERHWKLTLRCTIHSLKRKPGLGIEINEDTLQELTVFQDVVR